MPTTLESLGILVIALIPGFVIDRIAYAKMARHHRQGHEYVLGTVLWSAAYYSVLLLMAWVAGIWMPVVDTISTGEALQAIPPRAWMLTLPGVVLIVPTFLSAVISSIASPNAVASLYGKLGLSVHPIPKSWDYLFGQGQSVLARLTLTDGSVIGGLYADKSFAASFPADEDIYLEKQFRIDPDTEAFGEEIPLSAGVLISGSRIEFIEFFAIEEDDVDREIKGGTEND